MCPCTLLTKEKTEAFFGATLLKFKIKIYRRDRNRNPINKKRNDIKK